MQMYKVSFQTHYPDIIDVGESLVCAANSDLAAELIREHLKLPISATVFEVNRVKPSIFTLSRKEIAKNANAHYNANRINTEREPAIFMLRASCSIKVYSEVAAWKKFSDTLFQRSSATKAIIDDGKLRDLEMDCERKELRARSPAIELQSIYKAPRFLLAVLREANNVNSFCRHIR